MLTLTFVVFNYCTCADEVSWSTFPYLVRKKEISLG